MRASLALLLVLLCSAVFAPLLLAQSEPNFPPLTGRVVDQANLLDQQQEAALDEQLAAHEAETSNQIVVVTVASLEGFDVADYGLRIARAWRIGTEDKNNGIVLLVAPSERKVRIEVGYGLEGTLPDGLSGQIIRRQILPSFKENDYPAGIKNGVNAILQAIAGEYKAEPVRSRRTGGEARAFDFIPLVFLAMIGIPGILRRFGKTRAANGAFPAGFAGLFTTIMSSSLLIGGAVAVGVFLLMYIFMDGKGGGGRGGPIVGGFGGGSSSGGFGGGFSGGGGSFGGGGASGSW